MPVLVRVLVLVRVRVLVLVPGLVLALVLVLVLVRVTARLAPEKDNKGVGGDIIEFTYVEQAHRRLQPVPSLQTQPFNIHHQTPTAVFFVVT